MCRALFIRGRPLSRRGRGFLTGTPGTGSHAMADAETLTASAKVLGALDGRAAEILTPQALEFLAELHRRFNGRRLQLLAARAERQRLFDTGETPDFLLSTRHVREGDWPGAPLPPHL